MSIDILCKRKFKETKNAIDIAFPVIAIQCELTPPLESYLNSLERVVLQLLSCGKSIENIAKTIRLKEPIIQHILSVLNDKEYVEYKDAQYQLNEEGQNYLNGTVEERVSSDKKFGWMFYNPIMQDVLPFFWEGNIDKMNRWDNPDKPVRLLLNKNERETFKSSKSITIKKSKFFKAYKLLFRLKKIEEECQKEEIPQERKVQLFANLFSLDEKEEKEEQEEKEQFQENQEENNNASLSKKIFIRQMTTEPRNFYLHMRIIIDPNSPGGYRVESPFYYSYDELFRKYIQLFIKKQSIFLKKIILNEQSNIEKTILKDFLNGEIRKLAPGYSDQEKDFNVFILEHIPKLASCNNHFSAMYDDLSEIHSLMKRDSGLFAKQNIVSSLSSRVIEFLFNEYFKFMEQKELKKIKHVVLEKLDYIQRFPGYMQRMCDYVGLPYHILDNITYNHFKNYILPQMTSSFGNSIETKFINMLVIHFYYSNDYEHKLLYKFFHQLENIQKTYERIQILSDIRNKASHNDPKDQFAEEDYNIYMENVFLMINELLAPFYED